MSRAENIGDLVSADHKVLSEESESRNNHRYAVVVQDLATQWIQSSSNTFWSNGRMSPYEQKSCQVYFSVMHYTREESGKETLKNWTHLNFTSDDSMQRKC